MCGDVMKKLINATKKMPKVSSYQEITQNVFDSILTDPELIVVEKHFHSRHETNQVLFVIKGDEIDYVAIKRVTDEGTKIFKEL